MDYKEKAKQVVRTWEARLMMDGQVSEGLWKKILDSEGAKDGIHDVAIDIERLEMEILDELISNLKIGGNPQAAQAIEDEISGIKGRNWRERNARLTR